MRQQRAHVSALPTQIFHVLSSLTDLLLPNTTDARLVEGRFSQIVAWEFGPNERCEMIRLVKNEFIEAMGLSVTTAASALGVTRPALSALLNELASLSPEMALKIEKVFGVSMDTLPRMQTSDDIARTREREDEIDLVPVETRVA